MVLEAVGRTSVLRFSALENWFHRYGRPCQKHTKLLQRDANKSARERKLRLIEARSALIQRRLARSTEGVGVADREYVVAQRRPSVSAVMFLATLITAVWSLFILTEVLLIFVPRTKLLAILSITCPMISFVGYITPIGSVIRAFKTQDASNLPMPFLLSQAFLCLISISYGISVNSPPIWATNLFGLTTQTLWMAAARWISGAASLRSEEKDKPTRALERRASTKSLPDLDGASVSSVVPPPLYSALLATCLTCLTLTVLSIIPTRIVGFAMCLQGIILSASPLARLGAVLDSRNADSIPLPISLNMVLGNVLWGMFGFYVNDHVIFLPSVVGYTLGVVQILVIMWCWGYLPYDLSFLKCIFGRSNRNPETSIELAAQDDDEMPEFADREEAPETASPDEKGRSTLELTQLEAGSNSSYRRRCSFVLKECNLDDLSRTMASRLSTIAAHVAGSPPAWSSPADIPQQHQHGGILVALAIRALGVSHIFTLTGGHISPILVGCNAVGIKVVDMRDEKAAVFAADAYARLTSNIGVCAVTAGPGLTNSITAIVNAKMAEVPIIVLVGATSMLLKGRGSLQDIDQQALVKSTVKQQASLKCVSDIIPTMLEVATTAASYNPCPGPVLLEFPLDVLWPRTMAESMIASSSSGARGLSGRLQRWYLDRYVNSMFGKYFQSTSKTIALPSSSSHTMNKVSRPAVALSVAEKVAALLEKSRRPVIVVGSQAAQDVAHIEELRAALVSLEIPVWVSGMCRGLFGRKSGESVQMMHMRSSALKEADFVIIAGTPLDFRLNYGRSVNPKATLIVCNSNKDILLKNKDLRAATQYIHACPSQFLRDLSLVESRRPHQVVRSQWITTCREREAKREKEIAAQGSKHSTQEGRVSPVRLLKALDKLLQEWGTEATIVADGGDFVGTASYCVRPVRALGWLDPGVFGTLGVGGGFAVAAGVLAGEYAKEPVWLLWGDGSVGWSLAEFETMARHRVPCVAIVGNDGKWNQMYRDQVRLLKDPVAAVLGSHVNYHTAAEGYSGNISFLLERDEDIEETLITARRAALESRGPVLVNAMLASSDFREGSLSL
ncbi:hypothetical protein FOL47_003665 [Perkinsus chesapeaki]|uniref:Acetolactate synthase-like protein n=1 Tax=Perkinsus chesapeaki TaxID=330153 RepID=A0A7J6M6Q5_PERCH|nr:hypothetical protein FOL47_003665 [Perkinsus chesapeaki]